MPEAGCEVLLSYAWLDNQPPAGASQGWVTTLRSELERVLRSKLGRKERCVFIDHQLHENEPVSDALLRKLLESRVLVVVLSPSYLASSWCHWELVCHLENQAARRTRDSVFIVEAEPVERSKWPQALQDLTTFQFWHRDSERDSPMPLGWPLPNPRGDELYWKTITNLAHRIKDRLELGESAIPVQPAIWLAEVTDDLLDQRASIAESLRQEGFEILPRSDYPREAEALYLEHLRADLRRAVGWVQLLGLPEGKRPSWGLDSFVALQGRKADAAASEAGQEVLRWRSNREVPARVKNTGHGRLLTAASVRACSLEEFRQEILHTFVALKSFESPRNHSTPAGELHVLVTADSVDRDLASEVQGSLSTMGVSSALTPAPSDKSAGRDHRLRLEEHLSASDGAVIVYGRSRESWAVSQHAHTARILAERRPGSNVVRVAFLDGPPPTKGPLGLQGPRVLRLDCRGGFEPRELAGFVEGLRVGAAHV